MKITPPDMLCFALYSAAQAMQHIYKPMLDPLGLTYPQYLVMTLLWYQDGQGLGDLGRVLRLQSNTLTPMLKRMEATGLIRRSRDGCDERRVLIFLTDAGRALEAHTLDIPSSFIAATGLPVPEAISLRDDLTDVRLRLTKHES